MVQIDMDRMAFFDVLQANDRSAFPVAFLGTPTEDDFSSFKEPKANLKPMALQGIHKGFDAPWCAPDSSKAFSVSWPTPGQFTAFATPLMSFS